ncbi:MAG: low molecular weight phosphatase family protein, partial [Anaerolineales bacterium]
MPSVLFVCTANQCRSPLAQGLFQLALNGQLSGWRIDSAGTWAVNGLPPS